MYVACNLNPKLCCKMRPEPAAASCLLAGSAVVEFGGLRFGLWGFRVRGLKGNSFGVYQPTVARDDDAVLVRVLFKMMTP